MLKHQTEASDPGIEISPCCVSTPPNETYIETQVAMTTCIPPPPPSPLEPRMEIHRLRYQIPAEKTPRIGHMQILGLKCHSKWLSAGFKTGPHHAGQLQCNYLPECNFARDVMITYTAYSLSEKLQIWIISVVAIKNACLYINVHILLLWSRLLQLW